ncbi:MAG: potassium/proton antiporter [Nitriliruptoraceae bacterium]|nr:potassium/proton antiporter [Nitriliruptoraceae bacterium]
MELELGVDPLVLGVAVLLLGAVLTAAIASSPGSRLRVPGALLFLGIGMLAGDEGLALFSVDDATLVRDLGVVALLLILFEGGLTTKPTDLRLAAIPGMLLATVGVLITAAITGFGVWLVLGVDPMTAALLGAVVASTDAAAVFSMMRTTPLPRKVSALLRIESGANDPIAVMLTAGLLATIGGATVGPGDWALFAVTQLLGGVAVGAAIGVAGAALLRRINLGVEGLYPILALAIGGVGYGVAATVGASGFVAVYLVGLVVGAGVPRHRRSVLGFHEAMANAAEVGLFLMLGLLVFPSRLPAVALPALAVAAVLIFIARPAAVALCSLGSGLPWRSQAVVSWAGLRGAVPIVLATFPFTAGVADGALIFDVVFFVVLVSVLVQGTTLQPLVRWLGVQVARPAWSPVAEALPLDGLDVDLVEVMVGDDLAIAGKALKDLPPPARALVAAVVRQGRVLIPRGDTVLFAGDVLLLTVQREQDAVGRLTAWARGEEDPGRGGSPAGG